MADSFSPSARVMAACFSPSASKMDARFSRSAFICFSIDCWIDGGGSMAFSSTRAMRRPHFAVASSNSPRRRRLM